MTNAKYVLLAAALVLVSLAIAIGTWLMPVNPPTKKTIQSSGLPSDSATTPVPVDPRLAYETRFRNIKPGVKYVGDASCNTCHEGICQTYHAHPMGHSATFLIGDGSLEKFDAANNNPSTLGDYRLDVTRVSDRELQHRVSASDSQGNSLPDYDMKVQLAIGSGAHGRSYLSVEDGTVWQTPISWFSEESRWDVSPGFDLGSGRRRPITAECLYCHVNQVDPKPGSINQFQEPLLPIQSTIGCERCHGPGEIHVAEQSEGASQSTTERVPQGRAAWSVDLDTSIVNPKHLSRALQTSICEQCHLLGQERVVRIGRHETDFRPGMPFEQFVTVFVQHPSMPAENKQVSQFEQMQQAKCTTKSGEKLLCTSCHDPHFAPDKEAIVDYYRNQCMKCHESAGCTESQPLRQAEKDDCCKCHMPKVGSSNVVHTSITDHKLFRRPKEPSSARALSPGTLPLVPYHGEESLPKKELQRDLGIALTRFATKLPAQSQSKQMVGRYARERLKISLETWNQDIEGWRAMSRARAATNDAKECLAAAEKAYALAPSDELVLTELYEAADFVGDFQRAEYAVSKLIELNPQSPEYRMSRASNYTARGLWEKAEKDCRDALLINPLHPMARLVLAACLYRAGDKEGATYQSDTAVHLATSPEQKTRFREWFANAIQ
jgi:predicted CXXCH cytochrome family protein